MRKATATGIFALSLAASAHGAAAQTCAQFRAAMAQAGGAETSVPASEGAPGRRFDFDNLEGIAASLYCSGPDRLDEATAAADYEASSVAGVKIGHKLAAIGAALLCAQCGATPDKCARDLDRLFADAQRQVAEGVARGDKHPFGSALENYPQVDLIATPHALLTVSADLKGAEISLIGPKDATAPSP